MLADIISAKKNNLDALRLLAASSVIFGHASSLTGKPHFDPVTYLSGGHDYSGSLAVKFFFFISGLLVTRSLMRRQAIVTWSMARLLRLVPAFVVAMVLTALVLIPLFSDQGFAILGTKAPYHYVWKNVFALFGKGNLVFQVDGVFTGFAFPSPNGSIWTMPFEMRAYFLLACLYLVGGFRYKRLASVVLVALFAAEMIAPNASRLFGDHAAKEYLLPWFTAGVLVAFWAERIALRIDIFFGLVVAAVIMAPTPAYPFFYCAALFYGALLLSAERWFLRLKPKHDISYGVYLYGWPAQMFVIGMWPWLSVNAHIAIALTFAAALGWLSWMLVESKAQLNMSKRSVIMRERVAPAPGVITCEPEPGAGIKSTAT